MSISTAPEYLDQPIGSGEDHTIIVGDVRTQLESLPDGCVRTCITSPPYFGLRDYGHAGQIGLELTLEDYVRELVAVFREVRRVLADDGTLWLNLGDSYEDKELLGVPWRVAFALQADGWHLRSDIIWAKSNPLPESVTDRCTKAHEYVFLLSKSARYFYDQEAVKEPASDPGRLNGRDGRNEDERARPPGTNPRTLARLDYTQRGRHKRDVWTIATQSFKGAHFAVMPEALVEPCVLAGSEVGDLVLDCFAGSGTVGVVAKRHGRLFVGVELNSEYAAMATQRISLEPTRLFY